MLVYKNLSRDQFRAFIRVKGFLLFCGVATKCNGIFLPVNQAWFDLSYTQATFVPLLFFIASLFIAPLAGGLLHRLGYRTGILFALSFCALSTSVIALGHREVSYPLFLGGIFLIGAGIRSLLVAGGSYAMALGPKESESSRLSVGQAFYSIGALVAPTAFISIFSLFPNNGPTVVQATYATFVVVCLVIAWTFYRFPQLPLREGLGPSRQGPFFPKVTKTLFISFCAMFMYMACEVCIDNFFVKYLTLPEGGGYSLGKATALFSLYYAGFVLGRFSGGSLLHRVSAEKVLFTYSVGSATLFALALLLPPSVAACAWVGIGFFNSLLYPLLIATCVKREGQNHAQVTGLLTTGAIGGALCALFQGMLADRFGLKTSFLILLVPYASVILYTFFLNRNAESQKNPLTEK